MGVALRAVAEHGDLALQDVEAALTVNRRHRWFLS
jgi:hypothetical protein